MDSIYLRCWETLHQVNDLTFCQHILGRILYCYDKFELGKDLDQLTHKLYFNFSILVIKAMHEGVYYNSYQQRVADNKNEQIIKIAKYEKIENYKIKLSILFKFFKTKGLQV